jgi:O-antigen/teichoic acid export membrane protein
MNHLRRIARNSAFQAIAYGIQSLTAFFIPIYLARLNSAAMLGQYATMITFIALFSTIAEFGMPPLLIRQIARSKERPEQVASLVNAAMGLTVVLSAATIGLMLAVGVLLNYSGVLFRAFVLTALALGMESLAEVTKASFRGREQMEWSALYSSTRDGSFLVLALLAVPLKVTIDGLMVTYMISRILSLVAGIYIHRARFGKIRPTIDKKLWLSLFKGGLPFALNNSMSTVYVRIDVVFLSYWATSSTVGLYDAANNVTMRLNVLARSLNVALYPFLSSEYIRNKQSLKQHTGTTVRLLVALGTLIATVLLAFGDRIVVLLYGRKFVAAIQAVKWLALIIPLRFIHTSLEVALNASNRERTRATAIILAAMTNLSLDFILIPTHQMMGAVYATVLTECMLCATFIWFLRGEAHEMLAWRGFIGPGLGAATILISSLLLSTVNIWLLGSISVLLYGLIVMWMDRSGIELIRHLIVNR